MDPVSGVIALSGITLASLAGLRLKRNMQEGFAVLPATADNYPSSVHTSQTRYNSLTSMVNPLINGIIPVGSSANEIKETRMIAKDALGSVNAKATLQNSQTLSLSKTTNKNVPRSDGYDSIFGAINFCRQAGKDPQPFTVYNSDGSILTKGKKSPDGNWEFDEICGVCLSKGVDEEGRAFVGQQGMVLDPNTREQADKDREQNGYPFSRVIPSLGSCEGAPNTAVFASNAKDLVRFRKRLNCIHKKQIGTEDECALCYENDSYSHVAADSETNTISLVLRGRGKASISVKGQKGQDIILGDDKNSKVDLLGGKESDVFRVNVMKDNNDSETLPYVYGYLIANNANGGTFTMPLNLLVTVDDVTNSSPTKSGKFFNFREVNLDVATIRPGSGKNMMSLRGTIPFTFVEPDNFAAMDCPAAPYQKNIASVSAFATDQPCFAKGSKPGNYNDDCLRARILDAGCTNAGTLYANPKQLNMRDGVPQSLSAIYAALQDIKENDMIDPLATKMCSGRTIETPCDPYIAKPTLKFGDAINSTDPRNAQAKELATQCLAYLYNNKGANEKGPVKRVGPTYSGLIRYANNQRERKNIYCLPDGQLNPEKSNDALQTLATIADKGYRKMTSVDAVKAFLNEQLELAVDMTRNANTDPERKAAIANCFGTNLASFKSVFDFGSTPEQYQDPCGILARYVRIMGSSTHGANIQIMQLVAIDKNGENVALKKKATASDVVGDWIGPDKAVDGTFAGTFVSKRWGPNTFWMVDLGKNYDITKILYKNTLDWWAQKNAKGHRLQLLDENMEVLDEKLLNEEFLQEYNYLQEEASTKCKNELTPDSVPEMPAGFKPGFYVHFRHILRSDAYIHPEHNRDNNGWGPRFGSGGPYMKIDFNSKNMPLQSRCGFIARGYYLSSEKHTVYFSTRSAGSIAMMFNGYMPLGVWDNHAPQTDYSWRLDIPGPGKFPMELRYFTWDREPLAQLFYRTDKSPSWKNDLNTFFAYDAKYEEEMEARAQFEERVRDEDKRMEAQTLGVSVFIPVGDPGFPPGYIGYGRGYIDFPSKHNAAAMAPALDTMAKGIKAGKTYTAEITNDKFQKARFEITSYRTNSDWSGIWMYRLEGKGADALSLPEKLAGSKSLRLRILK